jgi:hypothetical protein
MTRTLLATLAASSVAATVTYTACILRADSSDDYKRGVSDLSRCFAAIHLRGMSITQVLLIDLF